LERVGKVARKSTVVFAGHDPIEAIGETQLRLVAYLTNDAASIELVVRVEPEGD
jgi:hypothetical protein